MGYPLIPPKYSFQDSSGAPLAGGFLYVYNAGTSTEATTYADADLTTANDNPIVLDARGEAPSGIFLNDGTEYKFVLTDSNGSVIWTQDDVKSPGTEATISIKDYGAVGDGVTNDTVPIQAALDAVKANGGGELIIPNGNYLVSAPLEYTATHAGLVIRGTSRTSGACRITGSGCTKVFDFTGADRVVIEHLYIGTTGATNEVGILLGRVVGGYSGSNFSCRNLSITGAFTKACIYDINCEVVSLSHTELNNTANNTWCYYTSTDNDKSVTSTAGALLESTDGATNTVKSFDAATSMLTYGTGSIAAGLYGYSRTINFYGTYFANPGTGGKNIELGPSTNQTANLGYVRVIGCQFEGVNTTSIYIDDYNCFRLIVEDCLFGTTSVPAAGEIQQATLTDASYGLRNSRIRNNSYVSTSPNITLYRVLHCDIGEAVLSVTTGYSYLCNFYNASVSYADGATDTDSSYFGRVGVAGTSNLLKTSLLNFGTASELTIASGAITATRSIHFVDTEADAATDDLETISGGTEGDILILYAANSARNVVLKDNTGNLRLNGDFVMTEVHDQIMLNYRSSLWFELSRSNNDADVQTLTGAGAVDVVSETTHIVTTGTDALTLANGYIGQKKFIIMKTDGGDGTLTPSNFANGTTIVFDAVGQTADLQFTNGSWHWMGGTAKIDGNQAYTETNVSTDRAFDADTVAVAELADVVGTLIVDLRAKGIVD